MQGIVVGVSDSATGAAALDRALEQAVLRKVPLTAVRAWDIPSYGSYYSVGTALRSTSPDFALHELQLAQEALDHSRRRVAGADSVESKAIATRGRPSEVLVEAAKDADLLYVGSRGVGALSRVVHLGSVSSSVLHHATVPVAVVPEPPEATSSTPLRVLVGVDDSPRSRRALEWGVQQARLRRAILVPLGVHGTKDEADEAALRQQLLTAADAAGASHEPPLQVEPEVRFGSAASELVAAAEPTDVLVVGTRGRGGFATLLLGSTTHQVAGHARCPVVVVPSD